ncbi:MAG: hypothetical protein ABSF29_07060 [Tepidisphaeraceae bacterium]|jgi:hypothetical protein
MTQFWNNLRRVILLTSLLAIGGCSAAGLVAYGASGTPKIKAKYVPAKVSTLVLVESYGSAGDATLDADQLGYALVRELKDHQVAQILDPQLLEKLREQDQEKYDKMTIDGIGRALGAKQVIYVNVLQAEIDAPTGSGSARGSITAVVRVVDAASGETRYPLDSRDGALLQIKTPWLHSDSPLPTRPDVHQDMVARMADDIGKLFYDWTPDDDQQTSPQPGPDESTS